MKKENSKPYLRPEIESNDFMVESGIAASEASYWAGQNDNTIDYTVVGGHYWTEE